MFNFNSSKQLNTRKENTTYILTKGIWEMGAEKMYLTVQYSNLQPFCVSKTKPQADLRICFHYNHRKKIADEEIKKKRRRQSPKKF